MSRRAALVLAVAIGVGSDIASGYPLDAYETTGMLRLEAYALAQTGRVRGRLIPPGARLPGESIGLRLAEVPNFAIPAPDPAFSEDLRALLGSDADRYAIAVLDLSDPHNPRLAAHNADHDQNPGSVGKMIVGLGWLQALADLHPDDTAARDALMRDHVVTADAFIRDDSHEVPFWAPGGAIIEYRPIREGDAANIWTWLDWMMSSSSNAAASTMMAQLMLLKHFGAQYPVSADAAARFFRDTPESKLSSLFREAIQGPLTRNGLDTAQLRQGSFFTREGKRRVPGTSSASNASELLHFLVKMEQGALVDAYSSLELKRLLYLTERRIRYASAPALRRAAVYFKSGSLYSCAPEAGFACGKYEGNVRNFLNSASIVETDDSGRKLHYIAVVLSNVLRRNSAEIHRQLATDIHRMIEADHAPVSGDSGR